jgi:death-on-curing protein
VAPASTASTVVDKAGALRFALVQGHAFVDGNNKRIGHAAMEGFLMLNGFAVISSVDVMVAQRWLA